MVIIYMAAFGPPFLYIAHHNGRGNILRHRNAPVAGGVSLVGLPHLTPVASVALPRHPKGE